MPFEPKIVAYLCTWCSYTGADTAGIARLKSPANLRAIRVPCSGRVSPEIVLRTFDHGADGVLILGCHPGECHYDTGNHRAAKRIPILRALLGFAGLEAERLRLDWVSASEGERFSQIVTDFTDAVRELGPVRWRVRGNPATPVYDGSIAKTLWRAQQSSNLPNAVDNLSEFTDQNRKNTESIRATASDLLKSGRVDCVIGYETGTQARTRPAFVRDANETDRLVWNQECTHNLTLYLEDTLNRKHLESERKPVAAVVVKACDERTVQVLLSENRFSREQIHLIGVTCDGIYQGQPARGNGENQSYQLQQRCLDCEQRLPRSYDTLIGEAARQSPEFRRSIPGSGANATIEQMSNTAPQERMNFWLSQFDRCIRCYACRQACPLCYCPTCLFERDDSLWTGMGIEIDEKRTFHLGRAYHLAGRCIGCNECERVCPMEIPISLINHKLAQEMKNYFNYEAGFAIQPSPLVTILSDEERLP
jgi:coenzyme F420-reducing hydrogenase delta subunit/ferredoxin